MGASSVPVDMISLLDTRGPLGCPLRGRNVAGWGAVVKGALLHALAMGFVQALA